VEFGAKLQDGPTVTGELVREMIAEQVPKTGLARGLAVELIETPMTGAQFPEVQRSQHTITWMESSQPIRDYSKVSRRTALG
jgi:hypothetical protein